MTGPENTGATGRSVPKGPLRTLQASPRARATAPPSQPEALLDGEAEALTRKAIELALAGDRAVTKTAARDERFDAMFPSLPPL
jgi:hypothetical protein